MPDPVTAIIGGVSTVAGGAMKSRAAKKAGGAQERAAEMGIQAEQGEQGILQNAAATGGLRGGNIQAALGQFRPQMLQNMIQQQYANLSGLTSLGQASASGQASSGQQAAGNIGNLYGQIGQAQAGSALGQGQAWGQVLNAPMQLAGMASGAGMGMGEFLGF